MKAVMISIRPEWCEKILNGEKKVEIRKTRPKLETPFKVYIYCTRPVQRVSCGGCLYFYEDDLAILNEKWRPGKYGNPYGSLGDGEILLNGKVIAEFTCNICMPEDVGHWDTQDGLDVYFPGSCLTVQQYNDYCKGRRAYGWHIADLKIYDQPKELSDFKKYGMPGNLTRPPQSWCYVEAMQNE